MAPTGKVILICVVTFNFFLIYLFRNTAERMTTNTHGKAKPNCLRVGDERLLRGNITANLIGGLGNHMWIYATLYALAKKSHRIPYACIRHNMKLLFPNLSIPLYTKAKCHMLHSKNRLSASQQYSSLYFDAGMVQKIISSNYSQVHICCYLQNIGFFLEYMDNLKKEFSLSPLQRRKALSYLNGQLVSYRNKSNRFSINDTVQSVGIHVRRGDMLAYKGIKSPPTSYFEQAMMYFKKKFKGKVLFIVSSTDHKWCQKNIVGDDVVYTWRRGRKSREEDFSIQVCCNHIIHSYGTFGWWIGFLSKGEVVAFKDWAGTSKFEKWYLPGQRYPVQWKLI